MSQPPCQSCADLSLAGSALPSYVSSRCAFRARRGQRWRSAEQVGSTRTSRHRPVGRPAKRRLATGFGITAIAGTVDGKENAHRQAKSGAGALPVSTFAASIAGLGLQPDAVYDSRDFSAEAGYRSPDWPDHFACSELSSCRTVRCSPSDQRKVIAERRRTSCMTRKVVTPARDQ